MPVDPKNTMEPRRARNVPGLWEPLDDNHDEHEEIQRAQSPDSLARCCANFGDDSLPSVTTKHAAPVFDPFQDENLASAETALVSDTKLPTAFDGTDVQQGFNQHARVDHSGLLALTNTADESTHMSRTAAKDQTNEQRDDKSDVTFTPPPGLNSPQVLHSKGSRDHHVGTCRACFFFLKPAGCTEGADCTHCHLCTEEDYMAQKKQRKQIAKLTQHKTLACVHEQNQVLRNKHQVEPKQRFDNQQPPKMTVRDPAVMTVAAHRSPINLSLSDALSGPALLVDLDSSVELPPLLNRRNVHTKGSSVQHFDPMFAPPPTFSSSIFSFQSAEFYLTQYERFAPNKQGTDQDNANAWSLLQKQGDRVDNDIYDDATCVASIPHDEGTQDASGRFERRCDQMPNAKMLPANSAGRDEEYSALSAGSQAHYMGTCTPCHFIHQEGGCVKGTSCTRCHLCDFETYCVKKGERTKAAKAAKKLAKQKASGTSQAQVQWQDCTISV
eukprot:GEMP01007467.1.p1 GENE.GEMP01007467.1~~GEMP01007467.1.p1  ORF type:complete len:498 (+),score=102.18 GEMP01007467.1:200-1693(+)